MLLDGFSTLGKSFLRILKVSKANKTKSRKQKQQKVTLQDSCIRKFSRSKYAKLIPSHNFLAEKQRSTLHEVTLLELKQVLCDREHFSTELTRQTHKYIIRSVAKALKHETTREITSFLRNVNQLIHSLKVVTEISNDTDLLAMYKVMCDISKEYQRHWLHKTMRSKQEKIHSKNLSGYLSRTKGSKHKGETEGQSKDKVLEEVWESKTMSTFELSLPQQKHSCDIQECLLNMTPRKAGKKSGYSSQIQANTACGVDDKRANSRKQDSMKHLNFKYGDLSQNVMHIEAKRLSLANETHCRAVATLVDRRLRQREPESRHLICMYVDYQDGSNINLSKLKYDMLYTCLSTYFFPRQNSVSISWTDKINNLLSEGTDEDFLTDIFERRYDIPKSCFKAVMVVSTTAADILRHRHLGMLDTVAVILGITRKSLLTVHENTLQQLFN